MAKVLLRCPVCDNIIRAHIPGDQYKDYSDYKDAPVEDVKDLDGEEMHCDRCDRSYTLMVNVETKPVARIGFEVEAY